MSLEEAVRALAVGLPAPLVGVLEPAPGGNGFDLIAGKGWSDRPAEAIILPPESARLIHDGGADLVPDVKAEGAYAHGRWLAKHTAIHGLRVSFGSSTGPAGILCAYRKKLPRFTAADLEFARSVANVLTLAGRQVADEADRNRDDDRNRDLLDAALDCIVTIDVEGIVVEFNPAAEETFGWRRTEVVGRSLDEVLMPERHREAHRRGMERLRRTGEGRILGRRVELEALRSDGTEIPIELTVIPVRVGGRALYTAHVRSLSERRSWEHGLRDSEEHQRALVDQLAATMDALPAHICVLDPAGSILSTNRSWMRFAEENSAPSQACGTGVSYLSVCDTAAARGDEIAGAVASGLRAILDGTEHRFEIEYPCPGPGAEDRWFRLVATPIAGRRKARAVVMHNDVTELRRAALQLERARDAALGLARRKGEFMASVSHEIRTPLTSVLAMTELLLRSGLSPDQRRMAEIAHRSEKDLLTLLDDVLQFSRLEGGLAELRSEVFDPAHVLGEVVERHRPLAAEKGIPIRFSVGPGSRDTLLGDPVRLAQVVGNLLDNAIKFSEQGEIEAAVRRLSESEDTVKLEITVSDAGMGISAEQQALIFEPFTQLDSTDTRRHRGTGLGLAICRDLVEAMGGSISVESQPGRGSTFRVQVQLHKAAVPLAEPAIDPATVSASGASRALRILVVEDDDVSRRVAVLQLAELGHHTESVATGAEALETLRTAPFDVVLLDCQMPVMDGYETARAIRRLPGAAGRTPIVALTARALAGDRESCLDAGMNDYLAKPVSLEALADVLERYAAPLDPGAVERLRAFDRSSEPQLSDDLMSLFFRNAERQIDEIRRAAGDGDAKTVARIAHNLKGSSSAFGARGLQMLCRYLEATIREGNAVPATNIAEGLEQELGRVRAALVQRAEAKG